MSNIPGRWLLALCLSVLATLQPGIVRAEVLRHDVRWCLEDNTLPSYEWRDDLVPRRAVIVALHGMTQHGTSFDVFGRHLAALGYVVVSVDLRGHGRWYHNPGIEARDRTIDYARSACDLIPFTINLKKRYPGLPIFFVGESVGSAVAIRVAGSRPDLVDGVVLVSAGTLPRPHDLRLMVPDILKGLSNLARPLDLARYILRYASDDPRVVNEMVEDPLARNTLTGREILRTAVFNYDTQRQSRKMREDTPVLIIQGEKDNISFGCTAKKLWADLKCADKTMLEFRSCGHVLVATSYIKPAVLKALSDWLDERAATRLARSGKGESVVPLTARAGYFVIN